MSMLWIWFAIQAGFSFTLMKPGPASVGRSAIMEVSGSASKMAFATSVGVTATPACKTSQRLSSAPRVRVFTQEEG